MKDQIRKEMKAKRRALTKEEVVRVSSAAAEVFLSSECYNSAKTIMLYMPLGNETDTGEIVKRALEDGKKVVLPVTDEKTGSITPYFYDESTALEKGGFSVTEPKNALAAPKTEIDMVLVPGIAFDRFGSRVGFGKGCYDMFLKGMNVVRVGLCYEFQLCDSIPLDEHDIKMDFIVTEKGVIECRLT